MMGQSRVKANTPAPEQFNRNLGFINQKEQKVLQESTVAIAGAGGDGGELAIMLAQMGVGRFRIADPESFEIDNLNRQAGASYKTIGQNKATVIAQMIKDINPIAEVTVYTEGITADSVNAFVAGSDLVVDETEYTQHELGIMLARCSRKHKLPVLMTLNVGFGSYTTSFSPDGKTFEAYLGLNPKLSIAKLSEFGVPLSRWVPHIPSYADTNILQKVAAQKVSTPTVATGVKMAASEASTQALAHLLKDISPQRAQWIYYAPRGKSLDVIDGMHMVRFPRVHYAKTLARAVFRTWLNKNPTAGL